MTEAVSTSLEAAIRARCAVRAFEPDEVDRAILRRALALAQRAPSNCNTQPWVVRVVSGAARARLQAALLEAGAQMRFSIDIPFEPATFSQPYKARHDRHGAVLQAAHGVSREDIAGRAVMLANNLRSFGAPHLAFFFTPSWGNERQASDVGMFAQTLALALAAEGVGSCPQAVLSFFADVVRQELGVGADHKLLYGMAIGYAKSVEEVHRVEQGRAPFEESIAFVDG